MERKIYFNFLRETSTLVSTHLSEYLDNIKGRDDILHENSLFLIKSRLEKPLQKPTLFKTIFQMCGGKDFKSVLPIATAFELLNISSYQANSAFDNKIGVLSKEQKDSQFICSMISREYTIKLINDTQLNPSIKLNLLSSFSKINSNIYYAQNLDLNILFKKNYNYYLKNETKFYDDYISRCYLGSGFFNGQLCYWASILAGRADIADTLLKYGENFGTGLHILNDLSDYIPNNRNKLINRDYQDQLSDFRNGRLTLPLYFAIKHANFINKIIIENLFLENKSIEINNISELILTERVYKEVKKVINDYFKKAHKNISQIENSYYKSMLEIITSVLKSNKFYHTLNHL